MMSAKKSKRLKIDDRVTILRRLENGESSSNLSTEYGITMSAISHMKKNKEVILGQKKLLDEIQGNPGRKRFTGIENSPLDKCLYDWYMQKQSMGEIPTGPNLQEQALIFNKLLNGPDTFKASSGFLAKFKKRYDIGINADESERGSNDDTSNEDFSRELFRYLETQDYGFDQIYNVDETILSWKNLPKQMNSVKSELVDSSYDDDSRGIVDDRVTIIACTNASGSHKLPLLVMGNSSESGYLKNIRYLPVVYKDKEFSWSENNSILDWYRDIFIPEITKRHRPSGEKCILLMNATSDSITVEDFNCLSDTCTVMYLPTNVDYSIQPMRQGIFDKLKKVYRKNLLRLLLTEDTIKDVKNLLASLTMLQCCNFLASSWNHVTEINIKNSWKCILLFEENFKVEDADLEPEEFLRYVKKIPHYGTTTIEEVIAWLHQDHHKEFGNSTDEFMSVDCGSADNFIKAEIDNHEGSTSAKNALRGFDSIIAWYQTKWECSQHNIELLEKLRDLAISDIVSNKI